jgi:hypothetical protein
MLQRLICRKVVFMPVSAKAIVLVLSTLLSVAWLPQSVGAVYKWVDDDGVTQYSQEPPPPGHQTKTVEPPPPPAADPAKINQELKSRMDDFDKRRTEQQKQVQEAQAKQEQVARRSEECRKAREQLQILKTRPRVRKQEGSSYSVMTTEQQQAAVVDLEKRIGEHCQGL